MRRKRAVFIAMGIFAAAFFALLVALVLPLLQGIKDDYREAIEKQKKLVRLAQDGERSREFEAVLTRYAQQFDRMRELFLNVDDPVEFFRFLDRTAAELDVAIQKKPGAPGTKKGDIWPSLDVQVRGSGSFASARAFLQKAEYGPYLLEIQSVTIAPAPQGQVSFTAGLKVYTQP